MGMYFLFVWEQYEASGGIGDYQETLPSLDLCEGHLMEDPAYVSKSDAHVARVDELGDLELVSEYMRSRFALKPDGTIDYKQQVEVRWLKRRHDDPRKEQYTELR